MTPPGDGLEFHGSDIYLARVKAAPEIDLAIQDALRNRPNAGIPVEGAVREFELSIGADTYVVFFTREGNKVGLASVHHVSEEAKIDARRIALKALFGRRRGK